MNVADLHPEELIDKLSRGSLTAAESERLDAHIAVCKVCRFELAARLDFRDEAVQLYASRQATSLLFDPQQPATEPPRRRKGPRVWGLAAATLVIAVAGLAGAISGKFPWPSTAMPAAPAIPGSVLSTNHRYSAGQRPIAVPPSVAVPAVSAASPEVAVAASGSSPERASEVPPSAARRTRRARGGASGPASAKVDRDGVASAAVSAAETPAALFAAANRARRSGDAATARDLYRTLQSRFPGSHEANLSQVTLATLQLDSGQPGAALADFDRYLAGSGRALEAEALVGRALSLRSLGKRDAEIAAWREVLRKYPGSSYAKRATQRLATLGQF
jgi:TolA-binding protein